jgi:hypothetical protein
VRRRIAVVMFTAALAFGGSIGAAAATDCPPPPKEKCNNGVGNGADCRPGKAHFNNDDAGGVPSAPGAMSKIAY